MTRLQGAIQRGWKSTIREFESSDDAAAADSGDSILILAALLAAVVIPTVLMLLFRRKYPRWWFDFNLEVARFRAGSTRMRG